MKNLKKILLVSILALSVFAFVSCDKKPSDIDGDKKVYNNETDPLVFSTQEVDKVFNPFFATSATDHSVIGMTQISMLSNNENGEPVCGEDEAVVALEYEIRDNGGTKDVDLETTYYFVLKNNVKFSNGSRLTIKDVLFNYYVYLDPVYDGSSTIYSTDIVGLKEYRTGSADENEQDAFEEQFKVAASNRLSNLVQACNQILDDYDEGDAAVFLNLLTQYAEEGEEFDTLVADYTKALALFKEELQNDYNNSKDSYQDVKFYDDKGNEYTNLLTSDVEMFFYNEGYIKWNKKDAVLEYSLGDADITRSKTEQEAINIVYEGKIPNDIAEVLLYWQTSANLLDYIINQEKQAYAEEHQDDRTYKNVSGIKFANKDQSVTVNGHEYAKCEYNDNNYNDLQDGYNEVLSITIKNVDPKAIWNFSIGIAPMYYYSNAEQIAKFDFVENFGVEYMSQSFMNNVVKDSSKIGVPVGAGPYAASKSDGGITNISEGDFYDKGVIYFERNPYYVMGPATIKKVRFQVCSSAQMLNQLYNGEIDFAQPNSKPETIAEIGTHKKDGIEQKSIRTSGYGYIGINAGKIPSVNIRRVIMYCINVSEIVGYYKGTADIIYRSMSKQSWAYPEDSQAYYPYIAGKVPANLDVVDPAYKEFIEDNNIQAGQTLTTAQQEEFLLGLIVEAGFKKNSDGVWYNEKLKHTCKYTFTIAGETTDHPAYLAMFKAGQYLNKIGFNVTTSTDAQALKKLSSGDLTVWAAAWGSTIDPDMYQVYHIESTANSVLNWGYKQIKQNTNDKYAYELDIVQRLSDIIDAARSTTDQTVRKANYSDALDLVMELAVELPTYQRDDLYAYNVAKINKNTLNQNPTSYKGLTSDLHTVALNTTK